MKKNIKSENNPQSDFSNMQSLFVNVNQRIGYILILLFTVITLLFFYKPYVIDRLEPAGGDMMASVAQNKFTNDYRERTGESILWNPAIFCGVPIYYANWANAFNIDRLISLINPLIDWKLSWFVVALIGLLLLFHQMGFPWYYALIGVFAFLFYPHYQALINVGHFAKIRAVCATPLVVFGFLYLIKKRNLIAFLWFTIFFSLQLRTQHYQIIFYTLLLLLTIGIWQIIEWIKSAQQMKIAGTLGLFVVSIGLAVLMSAQPLFVANEYTPYSTRGGNAITLKDDASQSEAKSGGVTFEYATRWSLSLKELTTLIVPRFYGGTSQEPYTGKAYPQLHGRYIPGYWGEMPFTQSSEYMGVLTIILALLGLWYFRRNGFVISLFVLLIFALFLALGSNFPILYKTLFLYLPYFSKFRVPSMILILINFILIILSVYGLKGLVEKFDDKSFKTALGISGFFVLFGLFIVFAPGIQEIFRILGLEKLETLFQISYTSVKDTQYMNNPQVLEMLRTARREFMQADTLRMLVFVVCFIALLALYKMKKIRADIMLIGIVVMIAVDMIGVSKRFLRADELVDTKSIEKRYFAETQFDKILKADPEPFRILGLGNQFQSNDLAYRYQIVTGYSPIKPQLIQDIIDNNLMSGLRPNSLNWNVINMLNAKYIIAPGRLNEANLTVLDVDQQQKTILYLNEAALPRAFFVSAVRTLPSEKEVVAFMNTTAFDPVQMALISTAIDSAANLDTNGSVQINEYTPNRVNLRVETVGPAFLVLADAYYPVGWTARIDADKTPIYQVNHVVRGIRVSPGNHEVAFEFKPHSYIIASRISTVTNTLIWIGLAVGLVFTNRERIKNHRLMRRLLAKKDQ